MQISFENGCRLRKLVIPSLSVLPFPFFCGNSIFISCGPDKYRTQQINTSGNTLGDLIWFNKSKYVECPNSRNRTLYIDDCSGLTRKGNNRLQWYTANLSKNNTTFNVYPFGWGTKLDTPSLGHLNCFTSIILRARGKTRPFEQLSSQNKNASLEAYWSARKMTLSSEFPPELSGWLGASICITIKQCSIYKRRLMYD